MIALHFNVFSIVFYLSLYFLTFGILKECPKRNGYFSKAGAFACAGRDELGVNLGKTPDNCQKSCDANPDCISFEISDEYCNLSSSCTYDIATSNEGVAEKSKQCLYVKQGNKTLPYQAIHFR